MSVLINAIFVKEYSPNHPAFRFTKLFILARNHSLVIYATNHSLKSHHCANTNLFTQVRGPMNVQYAIVRLRYTPSCALMRLRTQTPIPSSVTCVGQSLNTSAQLTAISYCTRMQTDIFVKFAKKDSIRSICWKHIGRLFYSCACTTKIMIK